MEAMFRCASCGQQWAVEYPEGLRNASPTPLRDLQGETPPIEGTASCPACGKAATQVVTIKGRSGRLILDNRPRQSRPGLGKGGLDSLGGGAPAVPQLVLAASYSAVKSWAGSWPVDRR
ncbi:MAG: hypothetical protein Q8O40_02000 [Chloroflexota bacterium]|nr:hypothetical protein [Chloroflexota bacterium]